MSFELIEMISNVDINMKLPNMWGNIVVLFYR